MATRKRRKKRYRLTPAGKAVISVFLVICIGVIVFAGWNIYKTLSEYKEAEDKYASIQELVSTPDPEATADTEVSIDWDSLLAMNSDVAGWLIQDDTIINYPVVYGSDNEYYLRHTLDGEYNIYGTLFVDYRNNQGFTDKCTVIYGHHFENYEDVMFSTLDYYRDQSYYDAHQEFDLYTSDGSHYKLYPISGTVQESSDAYIRLSFTDNNDFYSYITSYMANSTFITNETFEATDQVVLFSTCTDIIDNGRYALFCKLVKVA